VAELNSNVQVNGKWYGPAYPDNEVTSDVREQIANPEVWTEEKQEKPARRSASKE
jgi:hypothetical protein